MRAGRHYLARLLKATLAGIALVLAALALLGTAVAPAAWALSAPTPTATPDRRGTPINILPVTPVPSVTATRESDAPTKAFSPPRSPAGPVSSAPTPTTVPPIPTRVPVTAVAGTAATTGVGAAPTRGNPRSSLAILAGATRPAALPQAGGTQPLAAGLVGGGMLALGLLARRKSPRT